MKSYLNSLFFQAWFNSTPHTATEALWLFLYRVTL